MTAKTRNETIFLVALLAGIAVLYFVYFRQGSNSSNFVAASSDVKFQPIGVENPALKLDKLRKLHQVEYTGRHRNIFSETPPPPAADIRPGRPRVGPEVPPPPPPLTLDVKFYGYVDDPSTGQRRAFFTNGDDVYIVSADQLLENRYRLLRIGNDSADVEEVGTGRRATLAMVQPDQTQ